MKIENNLLTLVFIIFIATMFPGLATAATLGKTTVGTSTDTQNSNWINASRFTMGASGGTVTSMSVNVGAVAAAPNNAFQVAIYTDSGNSPSTLIAQSSSGTLTANSWVTVPISATLAPNTAYWLAYNSNGTSASVNNMRYSGGGRSAWTNSSVAFGTWPSTFGVSTKGATTFSIYATYTATNVPPPTVSLTAPLNGATVTGTQTLTATATNAVGVQFKVDGVNVGSEDTASPYNVSWDSTTIANGPHTLSAVARNSAGVTATSSISVTVNNQVPAPTVSMTAPANGATVSGTLSITASATNSLGVQFKIDGVNLGSEDTASPYSVSWDSTSVLNGSHTLSAVARNVAGITATSTVTVNVNNQIPAPTVAITSPADGATISGTIGITASATNTVGVQFKVDGVNFGIEDTSSPYSINWDSTSVADGSHSISAVARNSAGVTATGTISLNVDNIPTPDQPVLLIIDPANPYTRYYTEILDNEGVKSYNVRQLSQVDTALLNQYDLAILGEMALSAPQVTMLTSWVNNGGKLIAMKPDKKLASLLGLTDAGTSLSDAYLKIDNASHPGLGVVGDTIQYHSTADRYTLNGARAVALLYNDASIATSNPAVTMNSVGVNGGQAAAFTYDLARSVVQTRQGNVAWAGQQRDGVDGFEASEMFFGLGGQPNWNNLDKAIIPIADEQQRLLANMILDMEKSNNPLPRLWYLPRSLKAAVVMTGDDHGNAGTIGRFNTYLSQSPAGCNLANWECIRASSYIFTSAPITNAQAVSFNSQGFEIGLHVNTGCGPWLTTSNLIQDYSLQLADFHATLPGLPAQSSMRTHCVEWDDWATQPKTKLANGIRLDTDYYYYPSNFVNNRPGYFNGTGMPMRFADLDGTLIDVYQATTQITDESGLDIANAINTMLDKAIGAEGYFAVITANMHTDSNPSPGSDAILAAAQARGIPIVSGRQMLQWLDARNASGFTNINWSVTTLSFDVNVGANGLTGMLPMISKAGSLGALSRNGSTVAYTTQTIKGVSYAMFTALPGSYSANYAPDTTAPTIVSSIPAQGATNVSVDAKISFNASEPLDPATVTAANVELRDGSGLLTPVTLSYNSTTNAIVVTPNSPLQAGAPYTATAKSGLKDISGNALATQYQVTFTISSQPTSALFGNNLIGGLTDAGQSNWINGSRFVNGALQNHVTSMSVYVRSIDVAPNNKFQMAIYTDSSGSPGTLVASTAQGTLTANAWNTLPIVASLAPNTAYWLTYNTNGSNAGVNNMAYDTGSSGQGGWSNAGVTFGSWPQTFGGSTLSNPVYSIYAQ